MKIYKPNTQNQTKSSFWPKRVQTDSGKIIEGFDKAVLAGHINPNDYDWWELTTDTSTPSEVQESLSSSYSLVDGEYVETKNFSIRSDFQTILTQKIAQTRYEKETGGVTMGGVPIKTDRESQSMLIGATVLLGDGETLKWKTDGGFVDLSGAQIKAIAGAVRAHIQACFNREAELAAELAALVTNPDRTDQDILDFEQTVVAFWPQE